MDYIGILRRAYELTKRNRYLWIFGVLAGGASSSLNIYRFPTSTTSFTDNQTLSTILNNTPLLISVGVALFALTVIFMALSVISQGALVGAVNEIDEGKSHNFTIAYRFGLVKFWRLLGIIWLSSVAILLLTSAWVVPLIFLILSKTYIIAVFWGLIFGLVFFAFILLFSLIYPFIVRIGVLENLKFIDNFTAGINFVKKNWKEIVIMYLFMILVSMALGIILVFAIFIVGGILFAIGYGIYLASSTVAYIYAGIIGTALTVAFLSYIGAINTFTSSVYTLLYLKLAKSK